MRDIKFRAHSKDGGMEIIDDLYWFEEVGVHSFEGDGLYSNYVFMQYTGLKDKNGKDIYEGDILETPYEYNASEYSNQEDEAGLYRGKVHYQPSKGFIQTQVIMFDDYSETDTWSKRGNLEIRSSYTKLIGNIYENPELMEASK